MNYRTILLRTVTFFMLILTYQVKAQSIDFSIDLRSPIDLPLVLAGNFGELRSNHFHSGIDIKTNRKTGYKIYATEEGFVSRIRVSPYGYGHALYVDHPNGLTSVYAHLLGFNGEIQKAAEEQQAKNEGFEIDYYPPANSIKVKRGEVIAFSGNTGGSTAPHLHFELRDTRSEEPLNPLLFNFSVADNLPPQIRRIKVYGLTKEGYRVPNKSTVYQVNGSNGNYTLNNGTVTVDASYTSKEGGIGLAFDVIDKLNAAPNVCGIYEAYLRVDGDTVFTQKMNRISFASTRQINTHMDYEEYHKNYYHFHKAFKTIHNSLPIYGKNINNGILPIAPGSSRNIQYSVKDAYGNTSNLTFTLWVKEGEQIEKQVLYPEKKMLYPDSSFLSYMPTHYILFPEGILYEPTPLILTVNQHGIKFGDEDIPLQDTYKIMLPIPTDKYANKHYVQRRNSKNWKYAERGTEKDGWITTRVKNFGIFSVELDTIAPEIKSKTFKDNSLVSGKKLGWTIEDKESGLDRYTLYIDGQWYLLEYEPKKKLFFFNPPAELKGSKEVLIRAIDAVGNSSESKYTLTF